MHEKEYREATSLEYRKDYGQFFTPAPVARLMINWVGENNPKTIMDPAFGLGVFYDEAQRRDTLRKVVFTGYEIDSHIVDFLHYNDNPCLRVINDDYLTADAGLFDGIVCNPPYMRFQKFLNRHNVLPKIEEKIGKKLVGYANISSIFLVKALTELNDGGSLAFIMPFEFFNAGYGKEVKKRLIENHLLKQIIIFANEKEIFPDAVTTVCVLLCRNDKKNDDIKITSIKSNEEIDRISDIVDFYQKRIPSADLPCDKKWTSVILSQLADRKFPDGFCRLSLYGSFSRGIATGANEFFALTKSKIEKLHLPVNNYTKCIVKSSQIRKPVFSEEDFNRLYSEDKPVHCLNVRDGENPETLNYIREGEKMGYHERYLTRTRKTWHQIENRKPAPIMVGVFNRGRFKVVRNFTNAISFTCFHCFYPNMFGEWLTDKLFVYLLSDIGQELLKNNKRSYGDELDKFEPGDLNDCLCPSQKQFALIDDREALHVVDMARIDAQAAIRMSNDLIERIVQAPKGAEAERPVAVLEGVHSACM